MSTTLSCGHQDEHHPLGWTCLVKDYYFDLNDGVVRAFSAFAYCSNCMADALIERPEELFTSVNEAEEWVSDC